MAIAIAASNSIAIPQLIYQTSFIAIHILFIATHILKKCILRYLFRCKWKVSFRLIVEAVMVIQQGRPYG